MKAIISDIHANLEALCSVLADIDSQHVEDIICLGDIVGYGPEPEACVDLIMERAAITLMGNHDFALLNGPIGFNPIAADIIRMTRERMDPSLHRGKNRDPMDDVCYFPCADTENGPKCLVCNHSENSRWDFIGALKGKKRVDNILYVHASPLDPIFEYVFPDKFERMWNPGHIDEMMQEVSHIAFCGHTHHPCAIASTMQCYYPEKTDYRLTLDPDQRYIINVGSVGQPRDGDTRASYVIYDEIQDVIIWRRIEYNIDATVKSIEEMCGADNFCGQRLRLGK